eukprot:8460849-Heterocapsa_arctica.AAC.1
MEDHPAWRPRDTGGPSSVRSSDPAQPPIPARKVLPRGQAMGSADVPYGTAGDYADEKATDQLLQKVEYRPRKGEEASRVPHCPKCNYPMAEK